MSDTCSLFPLFGDPWPSCLLPSAAASLQSCPTLCDPMDCSPPGSPIPGILQARVLGWVGDGDRREFQKGGDICKPMAGSC